MLRRLFLTVCCCLCILFPRTPSPYSLPAHFLSSIAISSLCCATAGSKASDSWCCTVAARSKYYSKLKWVVSAVERVAWQGRGMQHSGAYNYFNWMQEQSPSAACFCIFCFQMTFIEALQLFQIYHKIAISSLFSICLSPSCSLFLCGHK